MILYHFYLYINIVQCEVLIGRETCDKTLVAATHVTQEDPDSPVSEASAIIRFSNYRQFKKKELQCKTSQIYYERLDIASVITISTF